MNKVSDYDREHIAEILNDGRPKRYDWFSCYLFRLIMKADQQNRAILRLVYPDHVAAYEEWFGTRLDRPVSDGQD